MARRAREAIARMRAALARVPGRRRAHQCRIPGTAHERAVVRRGAARHGAHRARTRAAVCAARRSRLPRMWDLAALACLVGTQREAGKAAPAHGSQDHRGTTAAVWALGVRGERTLETARGRTRARSRGDRSRSETGPGTCVVRQRDPPVPRRRASRLRMDRSLSTGHPGTPTRTAGSGAPCRAACSRCW